MSMLAKIAVGTAIAADAAIDISSSKGFESIVTGEKSLMNASIDVASSVLPGKVADGVTANFSKAISSDLSSSTAAILTNETKSSLKQTQAIVNSTAFQTGANAVVDYAGKMTGGQANEIIGKGVTVMSNNPNQNSTVQPNDAIQVRKPLLPILH